MSQELASYLSFYVTAISIIRPAVIIAILTGLWVALRRTDLTPAARSGTWLAVALALVTWFVVIWNAAVAGAFEPRPGALPCRGNGSALPLPFGEGWGERLRSLGCGTPSPDLLSLSSGGALRRPVGKSTSPSRGEVSESVDRPIQ